jgi:hypothetical protein
MYKAFTCGLLAAMIQAQAIEKQCEACWDGSVATFENGMCVCPPAAVVIEDETTTSEEPAGPVANPECTTGNASACKDASGKWDALECTCTFAAIEETADDEVKEDFLDENI